MKTFLRNLLFLLAGLVGLASCERVETTRIPAFNVYIDLGNSGMWNTYGVHGYGDHTYFDKGKRIPLDFPFTERTYTGFGGILLTYGINGPLAYDRACPYEAERDVVLSFDSERLEAYCPKCGSRFSVCEADGAPLSGPAFDRHYGLQRLSVVPSNGGYIITR